RDAAKVLRRDEIASTCAVEAVPTGGCRSELLTTPSTGGLPRILSCRAERRRTTLPPHRLIVHQPGAQLSRSPGQVSYTLGQAVKAHQRQDALGRPGGADGAPAARTFR